MNSTSRSTIIGHHRRRATVVVWAGYCSGLVMATALGLSVFALATQHYVFGLYGLTATVALAGQSRRRWPSECTTRPIQLIRLFCVVHAKMP